MDTGRQYKIFISAAEPSADAHCAGLINALRKTGLDIEFAGLGGIKMQAAGCSLIENTASGAVMGAAAFGHIGRYIKLINKAKKYIKNNKIDLVVVCDSPSFNFHIAKAAKEAGIGTLFYVAPQLWAWGGWRIGKLRKYCDKLCCILPFEQDWFSRRGIDATFVGNPLLDEAGGNLRTNIKDFRDFKLVVSLPNPSQNARLAILPGSRAAEIETLWPAMQQIAIRLKQKYEGITFNAVAVDEKGLAILKSRQLSGFDCDYSIGNVMEAARRADFAIVASGSATLQVAAAGCPMVIMYQSSKLLWHLAGKFIIKTKYLSLVNILADKELVPEFMPYFTSIEPVVKAIELLLEDKESIAETSGELVRLAEPMVGNAAEKVGKIVIEKIKSQNPVGGAKKINAVHNK
jgi:lipid-A-disaccharide synthase